MNARMHHFALPLAVLAALASGCETAQPGPGLLAGQRAYEKGDYQRSVDLLSKYLNTSPPGADAAQAYYVRGMSNAKAGRRTEAYADLQQAVQRGGGSEIEWRANVVLGTMHFEDGQWESAQRALAAAAAKMPKRSPLDTALFRQGQCLERMGQWPAARTAFEQLVAKFPNGSVSESARRRLQLNATYFSIQCGVYGDQTNANKQTAELKRSGIAAIVRRENRGGRTVFVVLAGRFSNYAEATQGLDKVRSRVPDALIWP